MNDSVEDLHDFLELTAKKQKRRRVTNGLLNGILNAVGVIFGTLVMTVLLVYAGQALIRSQAFQDWAQQAFEKAVSNAIKDEIRSFGN